MIRNKAKVKEVIKHNPQISEPVRGFPSTGHMFANADTTLTAISAQYQYITHGSTTVFIQSPRVQDEEDLYWVRS